MGNVEASSPSPQEDVKAEPKDLGRAEAAPDNSAPPVNDVKEPQGDGEDEDRPGLIRPDGSINWDCPCLGGMANGPCGEEFKAAFSCFHYSTAEQKGSDCLEPFMAMQNCFQKYPEIFGPKEGEEEDDLISPHDEEAKKEVDGEKSPKKGRLNEPEKKSVQIK